MKSKVAILIATTIIVSVLAAGCTSSTTQNASSGSTNHDAVLQAVINDDLQAYNNTPWVLQLNQSVLWINATSAMVTYRMSNPNLNESLNYVANYTKFGSTSSANDYVSSINQGYNVTSAAQVIGFPALATASSSNEHKNYLNVTQHQPNTISYIKMVRDSPTAPASYIIQFDNVVITFNATYNAKTG